MVAGSRYYTATGPLPTTRETESHLNRSAEGNRQAAVAGQCACRRGQCTDVS